MTFLQLGYLVHSPDNCVMALSTETGLIAKHFITQSSVFMGQLARTILCGLNELMARQASLKSQLHFWTHSKYCDYVFFSLTEKVCKNERSICLSKIKVIRSFVTITGGEILFS